MPLAQSLERDLGQQYLRQRGNKAFISDSSPVPFVINNDGTLSRHAAEVFVASLIEADKKDPHPQPLSQGARGERGEIHVLELGIGVGLFARYFLDHMQELSRQHKKDYYQRLTYTAADRSERMLTDVLRHGVLAHHPGRYRVRQVDAMQPEILARDVTYPLTPNPSPRGEGRKRKPFRAVFLNYLLDCLPAAVLQFDNDKVNELHVRTCVARTVKLSDYTGKNKGVRTLFQDRGRGLYADPGEPSRITRITADNCAVFGNRTKCRLGIVDLAIFLPSVAGGLCQALAAQSQLEREKHDVNVGCARR